MVVTVPSFDPDPIAWLGKRKDGFSSSAPKVLPPALITSAAKIVAAANGYVDRTVTSSPPSIFRSANFADSLIGGGNAGAPTILPTDPRLRWTGPLVSQFGSYYGGWKTGDILLDGGDGFGVGMQTNSRRIEISLGYGRADQTFQGRVNGQWFSSSDLALFGSTPDNGYHFLMPDFGTTATRTVELFFRTVQDFRGLNVEVGATLALPPTTAADVSAAFWGDSFVEAGGGLYQVRKNMAQLFGEVMGVTDIISQGRSNQGYVLARDGRTIAGRMTLDAPKLQSGLDVVCAMGSVNDFAQSIAGIRANTQIGLNSLMTRYSGWIVFFTSFPTQNNTVNAARNDAYREAAIAAASGDPRVIIIDTQALGWPLVAATTGLNPDGTPHDSLDGIHGGNNDVNYMVKGLMKPAVIAALTARAGL